MSGLIVSSTTDTPEQVQDALRLAGYTQQSVETIQTNAAEAPPAETQPAQTDKEKPPASAEPPAKPDEAADKTAGASGAQEEIQEPDKGEKKGKKGLQDRFDELTKARRDAERERDTLQQKLTALEAAAKPADKPAEVPEAEPVAAAEKEPTLDDFPDSYEDWVKAHQEWAVKQGTAPLRAEIDALKAEIKAREAAEAIQRERQPQFDAFVEKLEQARTAHADYDQLMDGSDEEGLIATPAMHQEIFESVKSGEVLYYLASHPEECKRIAEATTVPEKPTAAQVGAAVRAAAREIGRIEALIAQPEKATPDKATPDNPKPRSSAAPPPVKPLNTKSATSAKDPGSMSPADYAEWRQTHPNG